MSVIRPDLRRLLPLLLVVGSLACSFHQPAGASESVRLSEVLTLEEAKIDTFDVFGDYWRFSGKLYLDSTLYFDYYGNAFVKVDAYTNSRGLNYHTGYTAKMEIWDCRYAELRYDRWDGVWRAKVYMPMLLRTPGGGWTTVRFNLIFREWGEIQVESAKVGADPWEL